MINCDEEEQMFALTTHSSQTKNKYFWVHKEQLTLLLAFTFKTKANGESSKSHG